MIQNLSAELDRGRDKIQRESGVSSEKISSVYSEGEGKSSDPKHSSDLQRGQIQQQGDTSFWLAQFDEESISLLDNDNDSDSEPQPDNSICELLSQITNAKTPPIVPQQYRILCAQTKIRLCLNSYSKVGSDQRQRSRSNGRNKVVFLLPYYYDRTQRKAVPVVKPKNRQSTRFFEFQLDQADMERCAFQGGDREKQNVGKVSAVSNRSYFCFDVVYTSKILPRSRRISEEDSELTVQSIIRECFRLARRNFDSDIVIPEFETGSLSAVDTGMSLIRNIVQSISFYSLRAENLPFRELSICTRNPQVYIGWVRGMQTAFRRE